MQENLHHKNTSSQRGVAALAYFMQVADVARLQDPGKTLLFTKRCRTSCIVRILRWWVGIRIMPQADSVLFVRHFLTQVKFYPSEFDPPYRLFTS